jgi:hypothetical protein
MNVETLALAFDDAFEAFKEADRKLSDAQEKGDRGRAYIWRTAFETNFHRMRSLADELERETGEKWLSFEQEAA